MKGDMNPFMNSILVIDFEQLMKSILKGVGWMLNQYMTFWEKVFQKQLIRTIISGVILHVRNTTRKKEERRWSNETILTGGREKIVFFPVVTWIAFNFLYFLASIGLYFKIPFTYKEKITKALFYLPNFSTSPSTNIAYTAHDREYNAIPKEPRRTPSL